MQIGLFGNIWRIEYITMSKTDNEVEENDRMSKIYGPSKQHEANVLMKAISTWTNH